MLGTIVIHTLTVAVRYQQSETPIADANIPTQPQQVTVNAAG
jgi:hypothetical protein